MRPIEGGPGVFSPGKILIVALVTSCSQHSIIWSILMMSQAGLAVEDYSQFVKS